MLFNSVTFAVFLPLVLVVYWALGQERVRAQNALLVVASYVFYAWWDWRFLSLIVLSSILDFVCGLRIGRSEKARTRKLYLAASVGFNLGTLGVFKYFDFFAESFAGLVGAFGLHADPVTLGVILPVGISFYTFQTMSYTIDVYRGTIAPTTRPISFFAYVSFFPQLVAGPIERAGNLLPQFNASRRFSVPDAKDGLRQILWGLFKKVVIADNLAAPVTAVYGDHASHSGVALAIATVFFAFQIYCDFSGYSDIAIGTARLFGIRLMDNFRTPYFSTSIPEFWRRWHISLSTWFRDYVYIPLGGSRVRSKWRHALNVIATFTISGLWHGANSTFIVWGFLNGAYYLPSILKPDPAPSRELVQARGWVPHPRQAFKMLGTFALVCVAWVFFRAASLTDAVQILAQITTGDWFPIYPLSGFPYIAILVAAEWVQRHRRHALEIGHLPAPARWGIYYAVVAAIVVFGRTNHLPFIYFQF
ncbi:MAG: MBOAT family protein [Bacteroidota bacterium]